MQSSSDLADSSRGKDWVFNALWTSCSPALRGLPQCTINVPLTFLFGDKGVPKRALFSDRETGAVQQVELHDVEAMNMRIGERAYSNRSSSDGSSSRRMFAFCRKLLLEYSVQNRYADYQLGNGAKEAFVATVTYSDDETEDITLGMFDTLISSTAWRNQVRLLQAFVPKVSLKAGYYKTQAVVRVRSKLDEDGAAAADSLTRALSKYIESVFNSTSNAQAADNASMTSSIGSLAQPSGAPLTLVVNEMRAVFCLDPADKIVFLFTEYVLVKFQEPPRQEPRAQKLSDDSEVRGAVDRIISNLCRIFQQAQREGLPLEESVAHFDRGGSGFVDADMLIDGLARLGMGVTYTVAEGVLEYLAGPGSGILTAQDFSRLLEGPADALLFDESLLGGSLAESSATSGFAGPLPKKRKSKKSLRRREGLQEGSLGGSSVGRSALLPPLGASSRALGDSFAEGSLFEGSSLQSASISDQVSSTSRLNTYNYGLLGHPMARSEPYSQLPAGSTSLPLPLSAYTVDRTSRTGPSTELPEGASEGKRRALDEIKRSHRRWLEKRRAAEPQLASQDTSSLTTLSSSSNNNNNNNNNNRSSSRSPSRQSSPSRPSTTGKPGSRGSPRRPPGLDLKKTKRAKVEVRDELFDAGGGLVLAYRVLHGDGKSLLFRDKTREKLEVFRYRSILEVREKNLEAFAVERSLREELQSPSMLGGGSATVSAESATLSAPSPRDSDGGLKIDRWLGFTLLVVPGLFTTLDTLHKYLQPLLVKYPCAHLVLLGLTGAPNTSWPADLPFSPDQHAQCIMKLLHHLKIARKLPLREPMFLMSVGTGSMAVSRFVSEYLPGLPWLQTRLRALCLVNGCFKVSKLLKRKCKLLLKSMTTSIPQEVNELILSLNFWDGYYTQRGRTECIKEFWSTRRGLLREDLAKEAQYVEGERDNTQYRGVLEMLRGFVGHCGDFDASELLRSSSLPLVVVQSTEDLLLDHQAAQLFQAGSLPQSRYSVDDVSKLDSGAVYLHWLRAGHEVLQERPTFFLGVIAHLAGLYGVHPDTEEEMEVVEDEEDIDVLAYAAKRRKLADDAIAEQEAAARKEEAALKAARKRLKAEQKAAKDAERAEREKQARLAEGAADRAEREREREAQAAAEAAAAAKAEEDERLKAEEEEKRKARQAIEKEKRKKLAEERKKREARAARMRELEALYEMVRRDFESKTEARELKRMAKEDSRSKHAGDYAHEMQILAGCPARARARKEEMHGHRREEAVRRVEDQLSRKRSKQVAERRRKADEALRQLQSVSFSVGDAGAEGSAMYGVDRSDQDIPRAYTTAMGNVMKDLLYLRQQYIDCLQRQMLIEEKFDVFTKQQESLQHEAGDIRRKIRQTLVLKGRALQQATDSGELEKLRRRLAAKEGTYQELSALTESRQGQLSAANKSVQALKVLFKQRIEVFRSILGEISGLDVKFVAEIKKLKVEKEGYGITKDKHRLQMKMFQKKKATLDHEFKRVKAIKAEYVDSALVMPGVMQRVEKKIAKAELKKQIAAEVALVRRKRDEVEAILVKMLAYSERIDMLTRYGDKMKVVNKTFTDALQNFLSVSVIDIVRSLKNKQQQAEQQHHAEQAQAAPDLSYLPPLVREARAKDPDLRSRNERRFIGLDVILNPGSYEHVSIVEAEQMQFDEDYQWELSADTIERIDKLSPLVNLALPFLRSGKELEAHMILNMFKRNVGDDVLEERDHNNQMCSFDLDCARASVADYARSLGLQSGVADAKQMAEADVVAGVLVRESLRNGVRAKLESEGMSEEEREWLQLDKLLSPWVFDEDERRRPGNEAELAAKLDYSAVELGPVRRTTKSTREFQYRSKDATKDGNIYDEMRWRYEDGEVVFDDSWQCPYSREQLLGINATTKELLQDADALKAKLLMDKYYVAEEESTLGAARVDSLLQVQHVVADILNGEFERKKQKERELLDRIAAATSKKGAGSKKVADSSDDESSRGRGESEVKVSAAVATSPPKLSAKQPSLKERAAAIAEEGARKEREREEEERAGRIIKRVWGYWDSVHPASAGLRSQEVVFTQAGYDPQSDHPASYGAYEKVLADVFSDTMTDMAAASAKMGLKDYDHPNDRTSDWFIVDSVAQLALEDPKRVAGKRVLLPNEEPFIPLQVTNASLKMRQSRSHRFSIPDDDCLRVIDITVAVTFNGSLKQKWGRLAASLYLLPEEEQVEESEEQKAAADPYYVPRPKPPPETEEQAASRRAAQSVPVPVGYSPYSLQALNSADSEGRVIIIHKPRSRPIRPGSFQVVIGCASPTVYSIEVSCRTAKAALPIVDTLISRAVAMQERLPVCLAELESLQDSIRMVERKLLVCHKLAKEAKGECARCQKYMAVIGDRLDVDEQQMTLYEEERRALMREVGIYEVEYAQWAATFASRCRERDDVKEGIRIIFEFQRQRQQEKKQIKTSLEDLRKVLPACYSVLVSYTAAAELAATLNTSLRAGGDASGAEIGLPKLQTPAESVRGRVRRQGFDSLDIEEQKFCLLDQAMNPQKYEFLREAEEEENIRRMKVGLMPLVVKHSAPVERFRLKKHEIEHILETPMSMLTDRDKHVRRILKRFHDDAELLMKGFAEIAYGYEATLAERIRAKNPHLWSNEEAEWAALDKVIHKEMWSFYTNKPLKLNDRKSLQKMKKNEFKAMMALPVVDDAAEEAKKRKELAAAAKKSMTGRMFGGVFGGGKKAEAEAKQKAEEPVSGAAAKAARAARQAEAKRKGAEAATGAEKRSVSPPARFSMFGVSKGPPAGSAPEAATPHSTVVKTSTSPSRRSPSPAARAGSVKKEAEEGTVAAAPPVAPPKEVVCPLPKEELMRIWKGPREALRSNEEVRVYKLLLKYNGAFVAYMEQVEDAARRRANAKKLGSHIQFKVAGKTISTDIDVRVRQLINEIERVRNSDEEFLNSDCLHGSNQRFPKKILRMHLEEALDACLIEEIKNRERAERVRKLQHEVTEEKKFEEQLQKEHPLGSAEDQEAVVQGKVARRAHQRFLRKLRLKAPSEQEQLLAAKKVIDLRSKTGEELALAIVRNRLGVGGCMACLTNPCCWRKVYDEAPLRKRKDIVDKEITRVKLNKDTAVFESHVALSAQSGGTTHFKRMDLFNELTAETTELHRKLHLNHVDQEFHDAVRSEDEYFEMSSLHGYKVLIWTPNARSALNQEHSGLVAREEAREIVEDILQWMLEGWYFGEVDTNPAKHDDLALLKQQEEEEQQRMKDETPVGSPAPVGKSRGAGAGKGSPAPAANHKAKEKEKEKEKARLKVARDGNHHEIILNETESAIRFGLFALTIMYFRAIYYLRKKHDVKALSDVAAAGIGGVAAVAQGASVVINEERMSAAAEERNQRIRKKKVDGIMARTIIGDARRADREREEHRESIVGLQGLVRRQKAEQDSTRMLQRLYRGHLGRKAAKRWALKRAEFYAMHALVSSATVCVQRVWRGILGRRRAVQWRIEMGKLMALMRAQEATLDDQFYWETHGFARFKRRNREWLDQNLRAQHKIQVVGGMMEGEELQERQLEDSLNRAAEEEEESEEEEDEEGGEGDTFFDSQSVGNTATTSKFGEDSLQTPDTKKSK